MSLSLSPCPLSIFSPSSVSALDTSAPYFRCPSHPFPVGVDRFQYVLGIIHVWASPTIPIPLQLSIVFATPFIKTMPSRLEAILQRFPAISHIFVLLLALYGPKYSPVGLATILLFIHVVLGTNNLFLIWGQFCAWRG